MLAIQLIGPVDQMHAHIIRLQNLLFNRWGRQANVKPSNWAVDFFLRLFGRIPAPVLHNLGKASMIKRCMWHLNVDQIEGSYVEFGVAFGHSMRAAEIAERSSHLNSLGIRRIHRKLIGFDTFSQFLSDNPKDNHMTWSGPAFNIPLKKVEHRFSRDLGKRIFLNRQDATKLVDSEGKVLLTHENFGLDGPIALLLLDMDLYEPTIAALRWSRSRIQSGTIIFADEYFAFCGRTDRGEALAIKEFLHENPEISLRQFGYYGAGGAVFIVSANSN